MINKYKKSQIHLLVITAVILLTFFGISPDIVYDAPLTYTAGKDNNYCTSNGVYRNKRLSAPAILSCQTPNISAEPDILHEFYEPKEKNSILPNSLKIASKCQKKELVLLSMPEEEQLMLSIAAPVASQLRKSGREPVILALKSVPSEEQSKFLEQIAPYLQSCYELAPGKSSIKTLLPGNSDINSVPTGINPTQAGAIVAKIFWGKPNTVILASASKPEIVILGSTLAAHTVIPFIPVGDGESAEYVSYMLNTLGITNVFVAVSSRKEIPSWADKIEQNITVLDVYEIQKKIVVTIGKKNIRNIIVTRIPDKYTSLGASFWLSPYLSLMRAAPVVPCFTSNAYEAEEKVETLIMNCSLKPKTVTILADYDSIGTIDTRDDEVLGEYEVSVEPCSRPVEGAASEIGVGRIPFAELSSASMLIARGIIREYLLGSTQPRVLLISNPSTEYGPLPFCETISQATAKEFHNWGIKIDEFYGESASKASMLSLAIEAQMIIFEGHITDFNLFDDPLLFPESENIYENEWEYTEPESIVVNMLSLTNHRTINFTESCSLFSIPKAIKTEGVYSNQEQTHGSILSATSIPAKSSEFEISQFPKQLNGLPLVVLQSCHSLDESAKQILSSGAVGIVGSVTNIHSASGSSFVKVFCDNLLYQGVTIGEAIRDARNYLFCVAALKSQRGHHEQAKVNRVAYSFRLWGDPETRIFDSLPKHPKLLPVSAEFISPEKILISTPRKRLPTVRNEYYFLRMFPGNQMAGIVKRLKNKPIRRIVPMYFFKIPKPQGFDTNQYTKLEMPDQDNRHRAVFLTEPFNRYLYILYFPEKDRKGDNIVLKFEK